MTRAFLAGALMVAAATASAQSVNDFRWTGDLAPGKTIEIKNVNGSIRAELASGNQVEVVATKRARRSDPAMVHLEVVPQDGNVTICAVYPTPASGRRSEPNECRPGSEGRMNTDNNDVNVEFTIRLPQGVRLAARTVNGGVDVRMVRSDILVRSVNGKLSISTSGAADASTVNGSIDASVGTRAGSGPLGFTTVNGSITLALAKDADVKLHASKTNGRVSSDVPLLMRTVSSQNRHIEGTLGAGSRELRLQTVNGSIFLRPVTGN